jgi:hypothetical protein
MTDQPSPEVDYADTDAIPNPDAAGLIPHFDPPPGEPHPNLEGVEA